MKTLALWITTATLAVAFLCAGALLDDPRVHKQDDTNTHEDSGHANA